MQSASDSRPWPLWPGLCIAAALAAAAEMLLSVSAALAIAAAIGAVGVLQLTLLLMLRRHYRTRVSSADLRRADDTRPGGDVRDRSFAHIIDGF